MSDELILRVLVQPNASGMFWAGSLTMGQHTKFYSGVFEGPVSKKEALAYAIISVIRKIKKPVKIAIETQLGNKETYFSDIFKLFYQDLKKHSIFSFSKAENLNDLKDIILEMKKKYQPAQLLNVVEHDDYLEIK